MKSKPIKKPDPELEDDDDVEVESTGPAIAAAKKSKIMVIAASSVFITLVLYFMFFKGDDSKEKLEAVQTPQAGQTVAASEGGKSPFEIDAKKDDSKDDVDLLAKPSVPDVPTLPELPADAVVPEESIAPERPSALQQLQLIPTQPLPADQKPATQVVQEEKKSVEEQKSVETAPLVEPKKIINPRYAPIVVFSGTLEGGGPQRSVGYDKNIVNLTQDPIDQLAESKPGVTATYIADRAHTIAQGKLLTAVLETAINTELPGSVRAIVSRDVYGEAGNDVLIPKGSRLFGAYSSQISKGQARVQIGWTRLIRPDGVDLAIAFNAADQFGRAGLPGDVDNKYREIITNSLLTSVLAVGGVAAAQKLIGDSNSTTTTTNPTQGTTTTTGSATNQAIFDVSKTFVDTVSQLITNTLDLDPVIRVPQGTRITVIVNSDINVPAMNRR